MAFTSSRTWVNPLCPIDCRDRGEGGQFYSQSLIIAACCTRLPIPYRPPALYLYFNQYLDDIWTRSLAVRHSRKNSQYHIQQALHIKSSSVLLPKTQKCLGPICSTNESTFRVLEHRMHSSILASSEWHTFKGLWPTPGWDSGTGVVFAPLLTLASSTLPSWCTWQTKDLSRLEIIDLTICLDEHDMSNHNAQTFVVLGQWTRLNKRTKNANLFSAKSTPAKGQTHTCLPQCSTLMWRTFSCHFPPRLHETVPYERTPFPIFLFVSTKTCGKCAP